MDIEIKDVQSISGQHQTTIFGAFAGTGAPAVGDTIVVGIAMFNAGTINVPTDNLGNTYVRIGTTQRAGATNSYLGMFYAKNIQNVAGGSLIVSISFDTFHFHACVAWLLRGVALALDPYNGDWVTRTANTTAASAGGPPATPPRESITLGLLTVASNAGVTDGTGWNTTGANGFTASMLTRARVPNFAVNNDVFSEYKISTSGENATWTIASTIDWVGMQASFSAIPVGTIRDVQSGSANAASTQLPAFNVDPATGELIVVGVSVFNRGAATITVTDTAGNTYTRVGALIDQAAIPGTIALFYAQNITGGSTFRVTVTLSVSHGHAAVAFLITGADASAFNGDNISLITTTQNPSIGPTLVTPPAQSIFFGSLYMNASGTGLQPGSGWNVIGLNGFTPRMNTASNNNAYANPIFAYQFLIYKISSTVETATWTNTSSAVMAALLCSFRLTPAGPVTPTGGYWKLDETAGPTMVATLGPNATYGSTVTYQQTPAIPTGKSVKFIPDDALQNLGLVPAGTQLDPDPLLGISVECWIWENATIVSDAIVTKYYDATHISYVLGSQQGIFVWRVFTTAAEWQQIATGPLQGGKWHHVVGTTDLTQLALYIDGIQVQSKPFPGPFLTGSGVTKIGTVLGAGSGAYLDELKIYPRALTAAEVSANFAAGGGVVIPPPVGTTRTPVTNLGNVTWSLPL